MLDGNDFDPFWDESIEVLDDDPWLASLVDPPSQEPVADLLALMLRVAPDSFVASRLAGIDPHSLSPEEAVTYLQVHARVAAWWSSLEQRALVAAGSGHPQVQELLAHDPRPDSDGQRLIRIQDACREEIAAAMRWSPAFAQDRLDAARLLSGPLSDTCGALAEGSITMGHALEVVRAARLLPGGANVVHGTATDRERAMFGAASRVLEAKVLPVASRGSVADTRKCAKRAVLAIDADGARRRRAAAFCSRDVWVSDEDDGTSLLMARLSTEHAHACLAAIEGLAGNPRFVTECSDTRGERRSLALTALLLDGERDEGSKAAPRLRAHINVSITLDALLGRTDDPAELMAAGGGRATPVSADTIRDLLSDPATDITLRRLVTEPITGHLLDVGRTSYVVGDRLRAFVAARDRVCRFPGCRRNALRCQMDHADAWEDGGETSRANIGALCIRHHQLKTHGGWQISGSDADGSCTWLSPQGRSYEHHPPPF